RTTSPPPRRRCRSRRRSTGGRTASSPTTGPPARPTGAPGAGRRRAGTPDAPHRWLRRPGSRAGPAGPPAGVPWPDRRCSWRRRRNGEPWPCRRRPRRSPGGPGWWLLRSPVRSRRDGAPRGAPPRRGPRRSARRDSSASRHGPAGTGGATHRRAGSRPPRRPGRAWCCSCVSSIVALSGLLGLVRGRRYAIGVALGVAGDGDDPVALVGLGEDDALGVTAREADLSHRGPHALAALHDDEHLVLRAGEQRADEVAACLDEVGHLDAQPAEALDAVLLHGSALGVPTLGDDEQRRVLVPGTHDVHGEQL